MPPIAKLTLYWTCAGISRHSKRKDEMTTRFTTVNTTTDHSRQRRLFKLGVAASAAALVLGLMGLGSARGQMAGLQIIPQAQGTSPEKHVNLHVDGPSDTLQALLVFQPGAETGWHIHPGPVVVVVKSGALTETHSNGCTTVHPTGSVFFESAGEVHNATNRTNGVAEVFATFMSPSGAPPLISVPDPKRVCRAEGD
jgi:quercetin dioxygenase-like cupin family protein